MAKKRNNRNIYNKLPVPDSDTINVLGRARYKPFEGSQGIEYPSLHSLMFTETDAKVIAYHLKYEAEKRFHKESTNEWLRAATEYFIAESEQEKTEPKNKMKNNKPIKLWNELPAFKTEYQLQAVVDHLAKPHAIPIHTSKIAPENKNEYVNAYEMLFKEKDTKTKINELERIIQDVKSNPADDVKEAFEKKSTIAWLEEAKQHIIGKKEPKRNKLFRNIATGLAALTIGIASLYAINANRHYSITLETTLEQSITPIEPSIPGIPPISTDIDSTKPNDEPIGSSDDIDFSLYIVKPGDNLNQIASYFLSPDDNNSINRQRYALQIAENNNLDNPNLIRPGYALEINQFSNTPILSQDNQSNTTPIKPDTIVTTVQSQERTKSEERILAIGHNKISECDDTFNYGIVNIPGVDEIIVTDLLGVPGVGEKVNQFWKENCSLEETIFGTRSESTTNPEIVPIEVRERADSIRYDQKDDNLEDILLLDPNDSYLPANRIPSSNRTSPRTMRKKYDGSNTKSPLKIENTVQIEYLLSRLPQSDSEGQLSEYNLGQMIQRAGRMNEAYTMKNEGQTVKEIAESMGKSTSTVYKYIRDAKKLDEKKNISDEKAKQDSASDLTQEELYNAA